MKPNIFRPTTFEEYIGQKKAKEILIKYISATKERKIPFPHTLLYGTAGAGKTTLARIMGNALQSGSIVETIGLDPDWKWKFYKLKNPIIFIDEIHSVDRAQCEQLYTLMEDYTLYGNYFPFTLIGATTELGEIIKNRTPFYDRFKIIIELDSYTKEELMQIGKQYKEKVFPKDSLEEDKIAMLTENCRNSPRTLLRLLEGTIYFNGNIHTVLENFGILQSGYTERDLDTLSYIAENEKGVGLQGLCSFLNASEETYLYETEPYLLRNGLIIRTARGRKITESGLTMLKNLQDIKNAKFTKPI